MMSYLVMSFLFLSLNPVEARNNGLSYVEETTRSPGFISCQRVGAGVQRDFFSCQNANGHEEFMANPKQRIGFIDQTQVVDKVEFEITRADGSIIKRDINLEGARTPFKGIMHVYRDQFLHSSIGSLFPELSPADQEKLIKEGRIKVSNIHLKDDVEMFKEQVGQAQVIEGGQDASNPSCFYQELTAIKYDKSMHPGTCSGKIVCTSWISTRSMPPQHHFEVKPALAVKCETTSFPPGKVVAGEALGFCPSAKKCAKDINVQMNAGENSSALDEWFGRPSAPQHRQEAGQQNNPAFDRFFQR